MSLIEMEAEVDVLGRMEINAAKSARKAHKMREALGTLEFNRVIEHDDKTLVLFKYAEGGLERYETQWFEKHGNRYLPTYESTYLWKSKGGDKARIAKIIEEWKAKEKP